MNQAGIQRVAGRRNGRLGNGILAAVFDTFGREAAGLGIALPLTGPEAASRSRRIDPVSGDESLICHWCDEWGQPGGSLVVNPDGSFYAEQEVRRRTSADNRMVHSIRAWGWNGGAEIRSEVRWATA